MFNPLSRLEVNIRNTGVAGVDIMSIGNLVVKNRIPTVVCDPEYIDALLVERMKYQGKFKIITTIDFNGGKKYGMEKFRTLPKSVFAVDGFDILITADKTAAESLNEMKALSQFVKNCGPLREIRWVFGLLTRSPDIIEHCIANVKSCPATMVRTDTSVESILCNLEHHQKHVNMIKKYIGTPIKISGNVDLDLINHFGHGFYYDISVEQGKKLVRDMQSQTSKKKEDIKLKDKVVINGTARINI
jgi:hypothetical protein